MKLILSLLLLSVINRSDSFDNFSKDYVRPKVLTNEKFYQDIEINSATFVLFYAPWCSHCKRMSPVWDLLAAKYNTEENSKLIIAKVDCTTQTELCSDQDILSYPTLIFYKKSIESFDRYDGQRDFDSLDKYIFKKLHGIDDSVNNDQDSSTPTSLVDSDIVALYDLNEGNFDNFISNGYHFVKFYAPWCSHCVHLAPTWKVLAEKFANSKNIKISHVDCTRNVNLCKRQAIESYPSLILYNNGNLVGKYQGSRTIEDLINYLSEMAMLTNNNENTQNVEIDDSPVEVMNLNRKSLKDMLKEDGILFVKFYVKWCPHCKNLESTWKELAEKFTANDKVYIARIDCTENSDLCLEYQIPGYPSLYLFKNGIQVESYSGSRNLKDLYDFVMNHYNKKEKRADEEL